MIRNVSVGYQIHERALVSTSDTGPATYRVTLWTPMEISLVSVPADPDVGVSRSADAPGFSPSQQLRMNAPWATKRNRARLSPWWSMCRQSERLRWPRSARECARSVNASGPLAWATMWPSATSGGRRHRGGPQECDRGAWQAPRSAAPHISAGADQIDKTREAGEAWLMHRPATRWMPVR